MPNLNLEIISPAGVIFKGGCHMAVIPSADGEIGVMNGHEFVLSALKVGQIAIYDDKQELIKSVEVKSGFAEMCDIDKLLVLLD